MKRIIKAKITLSVWLVSASLAEAISVTLAFVLFVAPLVAGGQQPGKVPTIAYIDIGVANA